MKRFCWKSDVSCVTDNKNSVINADRNVQISFQQFTGKAILMAQCSYRKMGFGELHIRKYIQDVCQCADAV